MGQFDSAIGQPAGGQSLNIPGVQFHELDGSHPSVSSADVSSILVAAARAAGPQPPSDQSQYEPSPSTATAYQAGAHVIAPAPPVPQSVEAAIAPSPTQLPAVASSDLSSPQADSGSYNPNRFPHPEASASTDDMMGLLATNALTLGAGLFTFNKFRAAANNRLAGQLMDLKSVTYLDTVTALKEQADKVIGLVAEKSKVASAAIDQVAVDKPNAFQVITENLPVKVPGQAAKSFTFKSLLDPAALTEDEHALAVRDDYLRNLERTLVKDYNVGDSIRVDSFRNRSRFINGLADDPDGFAEAEGLSGPLKKLNQLNNDVLEETTLGRQAVSISTKDSIATGFGVLAGSFLATRAIDYFAYNNRSQGLITTAVDCAAPLMLFTDFNPLVKAGVMIGGHEVARYIDYKQHQQAEQ